MTRSNLFLKAGFLLLIVGLAGCLLLPASQTAPAVKATAAATATPPPETDLTVIPLAGAASRAGAQISGLAWAGDHLVLLPQYPDRVTSEAGDALLALTRDEILAFLDDPGSEAILIDGGRVVLFYEANGAGVYPQPRAPVYDRDLNPLDSLTLDNLERIPWHDPGLCAG